jgi:hypothetical protein
MAVVLCTPAIPTLLAFSVAHERAYNLLLKPMCCHFAQAVGVTSDPRITFPYLLKIVPARSGCVRRSPVSAQQRHHSLEGPINLARRSVRPHRHPRVNYTLAELAAL